MRLSSDTPGLRTGLVDNPVHTSTSASLACDSDVSTGSQNRYPQGLWVGSVLASSHRETIKTAPSEVAPSTRSLTKTTPESAKTRGVRMASSHDRRNYEYAESAIELTDGTWVQRPGGVRIFAPAAPLPAEKPLRHYKKHPKHGSVAGYRRHLKADETPCEACVKVQRIQWRKYKAGRRRKPLTLSPCGTYNAWKRHKRRGEEPCEPCVEAAREYARNYRRKVRAAASGPELQTREAA